ncbi:trophoblast glycoprotein a precursor [Danio rerio]|uniref:Trophoblast glycoprotein a n=1 Tax=Danio rerio TaxID=7955 RepID=A0A0R4ITS3_DANRE|nr:trophoblast glycoprotein a precursor [Danio rerio]|eukprot:NP_919373.2 trophoblast glycoprotein-like precursor [Danio rerio]
MFARGRCAVVLGLLCAAAVSAGALVCPTGCECSEAALTVKCVSKDLRDIPSGIPGYTRNLFITGNHISQIGPESFQGLENVTNLSLSNNRISEVKSHTFSSLRSLRSLDLSNNQLAVIHPEAFTVQSRMLRELNLSRALYNHSSVMDLATSLRWSSLSDLLVLDLSSNGLVFLPSGIFCHLVGLRRLQLGNNSIVSIHNGTFTGLDHLQELDLTHNALRTLREEALKELEQLHSARLHLADNPFTCTCDIEPFAAWLNGSRGQVVDIEGLTCAFPVALHNTSLLTVGDLELGCHKAGDSDNLALQTSYVFLGLVLGFVGLMFLFVLYLNRKDIKKRIYDMRDACREVWEGYHYRYEIDSDPRLSQVSSTADV